MAVRRYLTRTAARHPILGRKWFCKWCFDNGEGATWSHFPALHLRLKHGHRGGCRAEKGAFIAEGDEVGGSEP